jgi:hypothetical protein
MPGLTAKYGRWLGFEYAARPSVLEMESELRGTKRIPQE